MTWVCFLHYWPFVQGIHQLLVDSLHKWPVMQGFGFFVVAEISLWTNSWVASEIRCCYINVMSFQCIGSTCVLHCTCRIVDQMKLKVRWCEVSCQGLTLPLINKGNIRPADALAPLNHKVISRHVTDSVHSTPQHIERIILTLCHWH